VLNSGDGAEIAKVGNKASKKELYFFIILY